MKKIIVLLFSLSSFSMSFSQADKKKEDKSSPNNEGVYLPIDTSQFANVRLMISSLDFIIKIDSSISHPFIKRGMLYRHMTNYEASIKNLKKAISLENDSALIANLYYWIGGAYDRIHDYNQALINFSKAIEIGSKHNVSKKETGIPELDKGFLLSGVIFDKGLILNRLKRYDEAQKEFEIVLKENPDMAEPYFGLGMCYEYRGEYDTAIKYYLKAIEINDQFPGSYNNIASIYSKQGKIDLAIEYSERAVKANNKYELAWMNLAGYYKESGNKEKACSSIKKVIELNKGYISDKEENKLINDFCNN